MTDTDPIIVSRKADPPTAEIVMRIPPTLKYLRGHFPGDPVLPGVVQIKWALDESVRQFGIDSKVVALEAIKFNRIVRPNDEVTLSLRFDHEKGKVHFAYRSEGGAHSSGRIALQVQA